MKPLQLFVLRVNGKSHSDGDGRLAGPAGYIVSPQANVSYTQLYHGSVTVAGGSSTSALSTNEVGNASYTDDNALSITGDGRAPD